MKVDPRSGLTAPQVQHLQAELRRARRALLAQARSRRAGERELEDPSGPAADPIDQAMREQDESLLHALDDGALLRLAAIDQALARIADGSYGVCEGTGGPIGYERLAAQPWTRFSLEYQEQLEREARAGERPYPSL
jgi:DnaK suppressor protein